MDLSVIIVSRNTKELLRACLGSLAKDSSSLQVEAWVVDNASTDGSSEMVLSEFPHVRLIANEVNEGFARANNQALALARGRYCMLLNPDTVVPDGVLGRLVRFMDDTPDAGVAGCAQVYPGGELQITCHREMTLGRELLVSLGLARLFRTVNGYGNPRGHSASAKPVDWVEGGSLLIRGATLANVGPLDEQYFMYVEDADLCLRVRRAKQAVYYVPDVRIVHYRGQATKLELRGGRRTRVSAELLGALHRSKAYYFRKHFGPRHARAYWLLVRIYCIRKLIMGLFLRRSMGREEWSSTLSAYFALLRQGRNRGDNQLADRCHPITTDRS